MRKDREEKLVNTFPAWFKVDSGVRHRRSPGAPQWN